MMERYSGDFLAAIDGLRALLGCRGRVWPVSMEPASVCAEYADGSRPAARSRWTPGRRRAARSSGSGSIRRRAIHPRVAEAISDFRAVIIGPGSFYTSLMPTLLARGCRMRWREVEGPVILVANLLTEGRGHARLHGGRGRAAG